jgi:hypothetical protein
MLWSLYVVCLLMGAIAQIDAQQTTVTLQKSSTDTYAKGDPVTATIQVAAASQITIESDLNAQSSTTAITPGGVTTSLGDVAGPGEFAVHFVPDMGDALLVDYLVLPSDNSGNQFTIQAIPLQTKAVSDDLLKRFKTGMTGTRIKAAVKNALPSWLQSHTIDAGSAVVVCIVAGATAEVGVGVVACGKSAAGVGASFAQAVGDEIIKSMADDGTITSDEAASLKQWLDDGTNVVQLALGDTDGDRLLTQLAATADDVLPDGTAKVLVDNGFGTAQKYFYVYHRLKEP